MLNQKWILVLAATSLAGCATSGSREPMTAADTIDVSSLTQSGSSEIGSDYRIGAADLLMLSVFQVEDLSFDELRVDASGAIQLPLVGSVQASGKTPAELSRELEQLYGARYLRNPQIAVAVKESAGQKVTVDGAVTKPGIYSMRGRTTLLQAVAMAEGPTRTANLSEVAIFRTVEGRRMVALFDLGQIRAGRLEDPVILGEDVIVVDTSRLNSALRDIVQALPGLAVFAYL